jgi:hypothetical protein
VHLSEASPSSCHPAFKASLLRYLEHHGIEASKYHETLTLAWLLAVRHFMAVCPSPDARASFLEPDLLPIPRYPS